jgi:hypothetical protein
MSVIAGIVKTAAGAKVFTGTKLARKTLPRTKKMLVVTAVILVALAAFAALIAASQAPNAEHSSVGSEDYLSGTVAAPVSQQAAPQVSEKEALDAYGKLPLSFMPTRARPVRQRATMPRVLATGSSSPIRGLVSPSPRTKDVATHWPSPSWGLSPTRPLRPESGFQARSTTWWETSRPTGSRSFPPTESSSTGGCGQGSTWRCAGRGASSNTSSTSSPDHRLMTCGLPTAEPRG